MIRVLAALAILLLSGCVGGASATRSHGETVTGPGRIVAVDRPAPAWIVRELRHTYEPIEPCARPCPPVLRRAHEHVLLLHRSTALAPGALPRAVAEVKLAGGQTVTFYLYRSQNGQLCDDVSVTSGGRPITGALTPGLPCVPGAPCAAICLTQLHCCGANVIVGTVTTRAQALGASFDDGTSARYRLDGARVPGRPARRFVAIDLRPHGYADLVRLFADGKAIATGSVKGLG